MAGNRKIGSLRRSVRQIDRDIRDFTLIESVLLRKADHRVPVSRPGRSVHFGIDVLRIFCQGYVHRRNRADEQVAVDSGNLIQAGDQGTDPAF